MQGRPRSGSAARYGTVSRLGAPPTARRRARRGHAPPPPGVTGTRHRPQANRDEAPPQSRCAHPPPSSRLRSSRGDPHRPAGRLPTTGGSCPAGRRQRVGSPSGTTAHNGAGREPQRDNRPAGRLPTTCRR
ncbi:hypothetical protein EIZ62_27990 [Streptomyces ficellus]|uniref:Uncharacterized protein n=1 Tax=Streptomyces ficellus TaxID=1977088 RepID=A0A6I6FMZ8_9ACTN|nr:hypothetical protein EIZ62_27990 [Streptomyces ficellus]